MNRKWTAIAFAALSTLGVGFALAQDDAAEMRTEILEGTVVSIDASARNLTLDAEELDTAPAEDAGNRVVINIDDKTKIVSDGREIDLADIEDGNDIIANCVVERDGTYVALSIGVTQVIETAGTAR